MEDLQISNFEFRISNSKSENHKGHKPEIGNRKWEIGNRKSEIGNRKSAVASN